MTDWISQNKEWLFSGIGATILAAIIGVIRYFFQKRKKEKSVTNNNVNMTGNKSVYIEKNEGDINIK